MRNKNLYFGIILIFGILFSSFLISAIDTASVTYDLFADYKPYCATNCSTYKVINDTTTNQTNDVTLCSEKCYAEFNVSIQFLGDDTPRVPLTVNTSRDLSQRNWAMRGTYIATFGNVSDITGINEKLLNLTQVINKNLNECYNNISYIQNNATNSINSCSLEKESLNVALSEKTNTITEYEKYKKQRTTYGIVGILLGIFLIKIAYPWVIGRNPKKDPAEENMAPSESKY